MNNTSSLSQAATSELLTISFPGKKDMVRALEKKKKQSKEEDLKMCSKALNEAELFVWFTGCFLFKGTGLILAV